MQLPQPDLLVQYEQILRKIHKKCVCSLQSLSTALTSTAKSELEALLLRVERAGDAKPYEVLLHKSLAMCHQFLTLRLLEAQSCLNAGAAAAANVPAESDRLVFSVSTLHLDAIPYYQKAIQIFSSHPLVRCINFSLYYDLAVLMLEKGERKEAAQILEQALRLPPSQGATELLTQETLQQLFVLCLHHLEFTRAHGALKQLVSMLQSSKSLLAEHYLANAQLTLFLLQLQLRDLGGAKKMLADLSAHCENNTAFSGGPLLEHLTSLMECVAQNRHDGRASLRENLQLLLTTDEQLFLLDIICSSDCSL